MKFLLLLLALGFALGLCTGNQSWQRGSCLVEDNFVQGPYPTPQVTAPVQGETLAQSGMSLRQIPTLAFSMAVEEKSEKHVTETVAESAAGPTTAYINNDNRNEKTCETALQFAQFLRRLCLIQE